MDTTASDKDMGAYGTSLPTDLKSATKEIIFLRIENTDLRRTVNVKTTTSFLEANYYRW